MLRRNRTAGYQTGSPLLRHQAALKLFGVLVLLGASASGFAGVDDDYVRAIRSRDIGAMEPLIGRVSDVDMSAPDGRTALMLAARDGRSDLVSLLLQHAGQIRAA